MTTFQSWGRYPFVDQQGIALHDVASPLPETGDASVLPFGNGRSYGDSCLNDEGIVLSTRRLDHFMAFDDETGTLRCEAGTLLSEILRVFVPRGWFLPVTPGTKFITVGGAIANDVHGKNHHRAGTFGRFVDRFELCRSSGERLECSTDENAALYHATIGGLGLTGLITWADIRLRRIESPAIDMENIKFDHVDRFFELSEESDEDWEYTVAWVDCTATGNRLGRGHFSRGNHAQGYRKVSAPGLSVRVPLTPPLSLINPLSVRVFNTLYYERQRQTRVARAVHYDPFMYPLDSILEWNRIYGRRGFLQYQFVLPMAESRDGIREILERIARARFGSTLAVLKICGDVPSPGLMSFPMHGVSLALDFPYIPSKTLALFAELDAVVVQAGGRIYPAKDAHMDATLFRQFYPEWQQVESLRDPAFMSSLWRRVRDNGTQ